MVVKGTDIAREILERLTCLIASVPADSRPRMAVISVGDNPASQSYIKQKQKAAESIGATLDHINLKSDTPDDAVSGLISRLNMDRTVHGIIVQRPLPPGSPITKDTLMKVAPDKDIDGFVPGSRFTVPVADAVLEILKRIFILETGSLSDDAKFLHWLKTQPIAVIGKGETAGRPILETLRKLHCTTSSIDSATRNPEAILRKSRIVISCVGRERIVRKHALSPGVIVISVGLTRNKEGKLVGDYDADEISQVASFYTPTPGGVGPVNVACLMRNLTMAAGII